MGVSLGQSPRHARPVSLVLNILKGLTSPQFNAKHDRFCETVAPKTGDTYVASHWQGMSGHNTRKGKPPDPAVVFNPIPDGNRFGNVYEPVERHTYTSHVELSVMNLI
jgi:hypothetical protein